MKPSDDKLMMRKPEDIPTMKLRDEAVRKKKIKFDALCPMYGHYYDCTNLILKGYCPYYHMNDARKAYYL